MHEIRTAIQRVGTVGRRVLRELFDILWRLWKHIIGANDHRNTVREPREQSDQKKPKAPTRISARFKVELVYLLAGRNGRDFVLYGDEGLERFSARLLDGEHILHINWTDNVPRTGIRLREVRQLAGGAGSFTRITGLASDQLDAAIRAGTFDPKKAAEMLNWSLGGNWGVEVIPRPGRSGAFDITAELIR